MTAELTPALQEKLLSVDSPTISNAIELLAVRSRREGYMGPQIQCRFPEMGRVVGYATTATIVEAEEKFSPFPGARARWFEAVAEMSDPSICVVKDCCHRKGWSSQWGEMMGTRVQTLGAEGIVTDGAVRDLEALHAMGMKVWSEHVVVSHGDITVAEVDIPVEVGGLVVRPGDLLHADLNGVVSIPPEILEDLPKAIDRILEEEGRDLERMRREGRERANLRGEIRH